MVVTYNQYSNKDVFPIFEKIKNKSASECHKILNNHFPDNCISCNYKVFLYVISDPSNYCKVGVATNPHQRLRALQQGNPKILNIRKIWCHASASFIHMLETRIHDLNYNSNLAIDTKETSGHSEWFKMAYDDMIDIINHEFDVCKKNEQTIANLFTATDDRKATKIYDKPIEVDIDYTFNNFFSMKEEGI